MNDPGLSKGDQQLIFSWSVRSEPAIKGTSVSSFGVWVCRWFKIGVNLASDLFAAEFAELCMQKFPSHPPQYLLGIYVTGTLGLYCHTCQSPTLLNCFGQVMHILGIKIALIFPICTSGFPVSLFRPCKFGIVLKLSIVRVVQG